MAEDPYGYEVAEPDSAKYGYEDPDEVAMARNNVKTARRSSMKKTSNYPAFAPALNESRIPRRRASIQVCSPGTASEMSPAPVDRVASRRQRRTSVGFLGTVEEIPANPQQGEEWIQNEELQKIKKDNAKIIKYTEKGGTDKKFCLRGLEGMMADSTQELARKTARQAVLEEQRLQREQGVYDEDKISQRYRMTAMESKFEAAERAETDSGDILGYVKRERKEWMNKNAAGGPKGRASRRMSCFV